MLRDIIPAKYRKFVYIVFGIAAAVGLVAGLLMNRR